MKSYIYFLLAKNNLHIQLINELLIITSKLLSLTARKVYFFIQFCGAVLLNKKLKYNCNINCGGKQYHVMTDDLPSRDDTFNTPSFPKISNYDGLEENLELN